MPLRNRRKEPKISEEIKKAPIIKENTFNTDKGVYVIRICIYHDQIYFYKMLNGNVVEVKNLEQEANDFRLKSASLDSII